MNTIILNKGLTISGDESPSSIPVVLLPDVEYIVADVVFNWLHYKNKLHYVTKKEDFYERVTTVKGEDFHYRGQDLNGKSLCIFRHCGIGDTLFILPCLKELKRIYPLCKIVCIFDSEYISLVNNIDYIDEVRPFPLTLESFCEMDYYVNLEGVLEDNVAAETQDAYEMHAKCFGLPLDIDYTSDINIENSSIQYVKKEFLNTYPKDLKKIVIAISASSPIRTPDLGLFVDLINNYPWRDSLIIFVGRSFEISIIDLLIKNITNYPKELLINYPKIAGGHIQTTLALISLSDLVIAPDSGLAHVAGVIGKPLIGLFGAFPSALRLNHYKKAPTFGIDAYSSCQYARGQWSCCFELGGGSCKASQDVLQKYPPCMLFITYNHILKAIQDSDIYK